MLHSGTMFQLHTIQQITAQEVSEGNPEVKPAVTVGVITIKQDLLLQLEGRISSWEKMELVAHILKLRTQLLQKIKCINTSILLF